MYVSSFQQLKKFLKKLELNAHKIKVFNRFAFVCFRNEEDREGAIKKIKGSKYKGCILDATVRLLYNFF
jgi:RNA recognition motif-containing protein